MSEDAKEVKQDESEVLSQVIEEVNKEKEENNIITQMNSNEEKIDNNEKKIDEDDVHEGIFIKESDTFDIKIRWYKINNMVFTDDSDEFEDKLDGINEFTVTFKYPSQGDYEIIMGSVSYKSLDEMKLPDLIKMELTRLVTLIRKWSLKQDINRMAQLDPVIIKSMLNKVREELGMRGIL